MMASDNIHSEKERKYIVSENWFRFSNRKFEICESSSASVNTLIQIDGLAQDCSNAIANALELLQSCTKSLKCNYFIDMFVYFNDLLHDGLLWFTNLWLMIVDICFPMK